MLLHRIFAIPGHRDKICCRIATMGPIDPSFQYRSQLQTSAQGFPIQSPQSKEPSDNLTSSKIRFHLGAVFVVERLLYFWIANSTVRMNDSSIERMNHRHRRTMVCAPIVNRQHLDLSVDLGDGLDDAPVGPKRHFESVLGLDEVWLRSTPWSTRSNDKCPYLNFALILSSTYSTGR
jgi:hypothetical protein